MRKPLMALTSSLVSCLFAILLTVTADQEIAAVGAVLPFPEPLSASVAGKTLKDSTHQWRLVAG